MVKKNPKAVDVHVGSRVRMRRIELGMSQEKLAEAIGLTFQQVQKYEKGVNRMGSSRLHQIASVLQVPIAYFFDGGPHQPRRHAKNPSLDYVAQFVASSDGLALARAYMQIADRNVRRSIVDMVNAVAGDEA